MKNMPSIKVAFFLTGDYFDLKKVSSIMGIVPTETRTRDSFLLADFAHTEWSVEIIEHDCKAVSIVFEKLIDLLDGKQEVIKDICEHNIEAGFAVTIHFKDGESPEVVLPREVISFAGSINAEIGFDFYCYD